MKQRRIVLVYLGVSFGGITVYVKEVSQLLHAEASIFVLCVNRQMAELFQSLDVKVVDLAIARSWVKPAQIVVAMTILLYLKLRYRIDTVWINGYSEIILLPFARLLGCKPIATRHLTLDVEASSGARLWKGRMARLIYRKLAMTADKIICVSGVVAKDIASVVSPLRFAVIPNWISSLPEPVNYRRSSNAPLRVLFVGRLERHKGASLILAAMRHFKADEVSLTVVGEGECLAELQREASGLNVQFAGFQSATDAFYRQADLFINPSVGPEGLPLVSLEAMSFGLPCVFSDLAVHKEITDNGKCGILFKSGDSKDLWGKILLVLSSPQLLQTYGELGRKTVEGRYNADCARTEYMKALAL